jgi:formylglycine-generating enzyme required for sulfatase activity
MWALLACVLAAGCAREEQPVASDQGPAAGHGSEKKTLPPLLTFELGKGVRLELVLIQPGTFLMGDADGMENAKPVHKVAITKPFYLGKHEVTQQQWEAVMGGNPSEFRAPENPVDSVNWDDCQAFCKKLNTKFRDRAAKFFLPTEAQWEYACRAGSTSRFCFGDEDAKIGDYAWFYDNADGRTLPVGRKKPNPWGLYDMHGNVSEWCADWYGPEYYKCSPSRDPAGPASGLSRANRGGHWRNLPSGCTSAFRATNSSRRDFLIGFRVACEAEADGK